MDPLNFLVNSLENLAKQFASNRFLLYFDENNLIYTVYSDPESLLNQDGVIFEQIKKIDEGFFSVHPEYLLVWQHEKPDEDEVLVFQIEGLFYKMLQTLNKIAQDLIIHHPVKIESTANFNLVHFHNLQLQSIEEASNCFNFDEWLAEEIENKECYPVIESEKDYSQAA